MINSPSPVREPLPQTVCVDLPLYQLLPEHPLWDDPGPLPWHGAGVTQGPGVQEREDVLGNMIQTLQRRRINLCCLGSSVKGVFTFLGRSEMKSLWSIGLRNALTVPCWWCCMDLSSSSTNSIWSCSVHEEKWSRQISRSFRYLKKGTMISNWNKSSRKHIINVTKCFGETLRGRYQMPDTQVENWDLRNGTQNCKQELSLRNKPFHVTEGWWRESLSLSLYLHHDIIYQE